MFWVVLGLFNLSFVVLLLCISLGWWLGGWLLIELGLFCCVGFWGWFGVLVLDCLWLVSLWVGCVRIGVWGLVLYLFW